MLEEGVATIRDIDLGDDDRRPASSRRRSRAPMPPASTTSWRRSSARRPSGASDFEPPLILRRLVAQGRLGQKAGQGFFPYPRPDDGFEQGETVKLETRGDDRDRLADQPAGQLASRPSSSGDLKKVWEHVEGSDEVRALVIASANPMLFCAGRGHQGVHQDGRGRRPRAARRRPRAAALLRDLEHGRRSPPSTRSPSAAAASWPWPATCASPPSRRPSASPRSTSGSSPASAARSGCRGSWARRKALEMNLIGDADLGRRGVRVRPRQPRWSPDHELFDTALAWARKLGGQAPLAVEQIKQVSAQGRPRRGHRGREGTAFATVFGSEDAREGIGAFLRQAHAASGRASSPTRCTAGGSPS